MAGYSTDTAHFSPLGGGFSRMYVARLVDSKDAAPCETELDLLSRGIPVTRLRSQDVCAGTVLDDKTVRLLGQLYDAIIVPASLEPKALDIELAAGVPVVTEREVA
jgi:hypothetical protein